MKLLGMVVVMVVAVALQISFIPALRPLGVVPELVLIAIVALATGGSIVQAMVLAVASGIVLDTVSSSDFGLQTGLLALAVILCAFVRRSGFQIGRRLQLVIVTTVISSLGSVIIISELVLAGVQVQAATAIGRWTTLELLNIGIVIILGPVLTRLARVQSGHEVLE